MDAALVYVGDPMCSWCYGFGPQLARMRVHFQGRLPMRLVLGGLRPYTTGPMDARMREFLRHHWQEVQARSGRPFDYARLDHEGFVYDTEPACRAVVTARELAPDTAFDFFDAVQRAFYAQGADTGRAQIYTPLAVAAGLDPDRFDRTFAAPATRAATAADFDEAHRLGVTGFPTLLLDFGARTQAVCTGFTPAQSVVDAIEARIGGAAAR